MDHAEEAKKLFLAGYNCAQAVFCAYRDVTGLDMDTAARLASSFGAGMGRLREVCGTMSGALMVLGMIRGYVPGAERHDPVPGTAQGRAGDGGRRARGANERILRAASVPASGRGGRRAA